MATITVWVNKNRYYKEICLLGLDVMVTELVSLDQLKVNSEFDPYR